MNKINKLVILAILVTSTVISSAATNTWVFSASGGGSTLLENHGGTVVNTTLELGKQGVLLAPVEVGLRQSIGYSTASDNAVFDTKLYFDVFPLHFKKFEFGVGVNAGANYGVDEPPTWQAAPEGVIRWWAKENAGLFVRVAYPFDLNHQTFGDRLDYVVGMSIRW